MNNDKRRLIVVVFLSIFMIAFGLYFSMYGTLQSSIIEFYRIRLDQASLFIVVQNVGTLASIMIVTFVVDRLNKNRLIGFMVLMMGLFLILAGTAPKFTVLLVFFALLGAVSPIANNTCSSHVSDLYGKNRAKYLGIVHAFYGLGSLLGPAYAAWMLRSGKGWNGSYSHFGYVLIAVSIFFFSTLFIVKEPVSLVKNIDENGNRKKVSVRLLFKKRNILVIGLVSVCVAGFELLPSWLPTYLLRQDPATYTIDHCSMIMTLYFVGMIISRLSYSVFSRWVTPNRYIKISSLTSAAILTVALLFQADWLWYVCLFLLGLISGALYTTQYALAFQELPEYSAAVTSVISFSTACGNILINALLGNIANLGFFKLAMFIPVISIGFASIIITFAYKPSAETDSKGCP